MHAKALICDENQSFSYADVALPDPGPEHLLIRALYSGVSIGTEFALIRNKIAGQQYPLCTGYQGVGVVEHVGEKVDAFKVGDKVYYRDNREGMQLPDGTKVSAAAGVHCSLLSSARKQRTAWNCCPKMSPTTLRACLSCQRSA